MEVVNRESDDPFLQLLRDSSSKISDHVQCAIGAVSLRFSRPQEDACHTSVSATLNSCVELPGKAAHRARIVVRQDQLDKSARGNQVKLTRPPGIKLIVKGP